MKMNQFEWITGLDESGWIALTLFAIFVIITLTAVVMMLKLRKSLYTSEHKTPDEDEDLPLTVPRQAKPAPSQPKKPAPTQSRKPAPAQPGADKTVINDSHANVIDEAEVFLTYGLHKQAIDLLEEHLAKNPKDPAARELLAQVQPSRQTQAQL